MILMGLFDKLRSRFDRRVWTVPFEGSATPPGFRPEGGGIPPRGIGGPDTLMTRGEKDGPHTTVRFPESMTGGEKKS